MNKQIKKVKNRDRIRMRIRKKLTGSTERPRVRVFRSNKYIYAQIIDDSTRKTLASATDKDAPGKAKTGNKTDRAKEIGKELGEKAKKAKVETIRFDRGGYKFHGRVKALAEGLREAGLKF